MKYIYLNFKNKINPKSSKSYLAHTILYQHILGLYGMLGFKTLGYLELRISRTNFTGPELFEISGVYCNVFWMPLNSHDFLNAMKMIGITITNKIYDKYNNDNYF